MPKRKSSDRVQIGLRIREELRAKLEKSAKAHEVSLNTEIANRLKETFRREKRVEDIHDAVVGRFCEMVGGKDQFNFWMNAGIQPEYFGIDVTAQVPDTEETKFPVLILQGPYVADPTSPPQGGTFRLRSVNVTLRRAVELNDAIELALKEHGMGGFMMNATITGPGHAKRSEKEKAK